MQFDCRGAVFVAAIGLSACFVPALAQQAAKPVAAVADDFRHPLGNGNLTENFGDADGWHVSKGFGDPFGKACSTTSSPICYHLGENWNAAQGTNGKPVYAVANGEILEVGYAPAAAGGRLPGSLGNYILIKHTLPGTGRHVPGHGLVKTVVSLYAHLADLKGVCGSDSVTCTVGQAVAKGALIGHIGKTGLAATLGPSLHFEIRLNEQKCVNTPTQPKPNASCLAYAKARYPLKFGPQGGWVDPTCFIKNLEAPQNDRFATAVAIKVGAPLKGNNLCATRETGEPNHAGKVINSNGLNDGGRSVWWKFTAPKSVKYVVSTIGSKFDTTLGVYTRGANAQLKSLKAVAKQNALENPKLCTSAKYCTSKVTFAATAGTTYYIAVDGRSMATTAAAGGAVQLTVAEAGPALVVSGTSASIGPSFEGGPFTPSKIQFSVSASQGTVAYAISNVPPWLTASSVFGNATTSPRLITFTVNAKANALTEGTHTATIVFASGGSQAPQTRTVALKVRKLPTLNMTPAEDLSASGGQGGPFSQPSFQYQLKATAGSMSYTISGVPNWLTVNAPSGTVTTAPKTVTFTLNANAKNLAPGNHNATVTVTTIAKAQGTAVQAAPKKTTRKIRLTITGTLKGPLAPTAPSPPQSAPGAPPLPPIGYLLNNAGSYLLDSKGQRLVGS